MEKFVGYETNVKGNYLKIKGIFQDPCQKAHRVRIPFLSNGFSDLPI
jgi:hypothetical protein